jgi:catechol 2,3-dioxygenase-like lactoylglutathione lyase family enzyme
MKPYSVTLSVGDIDRMSRWYQNTLEFRPISAKDYPEFKTRLIFLERDGFRIELIEDIRSRVGPERPDPPGHTTMRGVSQFAFEVDNIETTKQQLGDKGAEFVWELQRYPDLGVAFLFVRDPEGNLIQFIERLTR